MGRTYRVAVLGCGAMGGRNDSQRGWTPERPPLSHAGAYRATPGVELAAAADQDPARLEEFGRFWNVGALYPDALRLLERETLDIVSICTPINTHAPLIEEAARRGIRAVFCEKPLAFDFGEAARAVAAAEASGMVLQVNYGRRWSAEIGALAEELRSGEWGAVRRVSVFYPGGIVGNGTHALDLVRWLAGDLESVRALTPTRADDLDPALDVLGWTKSGVPCLLQSCNPRDYSLLEIDILTERGRVRLAGNGRRIERVRALPDSHFPGYRLLSPAVETRETDWEAALRHAVAELAVCLEQGGRPRCSGEESMEALRAAEAIRVSAREGSRDVTLASVTVGLPAGGRGGRWA